MDEILRQKNLAFVELLHRVRLEEHTPSDVRWLRTMIRRVPPPGVDLPRLEIYLTLVPLVPLHLVPNSATAMD